MEPNKQQIKNRRDLSEEIATYYLLQEQWENEGGAPINQTEKLPSPKAGQLKKEDDYVTGNKWMF